MNTTDKINEFKATIGKFVEETKSTDIYKFLEWIECRFRAADKLMEESRLKK